MERENKRVSGGAKGQWMVILNTNDSANFYCDATTFEAASNGLQALELHVKWALQSLT